MKQRWTLFILLWTLFVALPCMAQEPARLFISAIEAYKSEDYAAAVAGLEEIAQGGVRNGQLFYNLGNAHLKNNDLGRAILWYERALQLIPNDPDLNFNMTYARSLTQDAAEEDTSALIRIFFFWKFQLSNLTIMMGAMAGNLLFWCLAAGYRITRRRNLRRAMLIVMVPAAVFMLTAAYNAYESAHRSQGIVLAEQIPVRSGLEPTSTELFILHAGAKVKVVKKIDAHFQIQFTKDKIGWVAKEQVGLI